MGNCDDFATNDTDSIHDLFQATLEQAPQLLPHWTALVIFATGLSLMELRATITRSQAGGRPIPASLPVPVPPA